MHLAIGAVVLQGDVDTVVEQQQRMLLARGIGVYQIHLRAVVLTTGREGVVYQRGVLHQLQLA